MHTPRITPALDAIRRSAVGAVPVHSVADVLARKALRACFQPIVRLRDGAVVAHEGLIRGPQDSPLQAPDLLFAAARREHLGVQLELRCLQVQVRSWAAHELPTRVFLNLSAVSLVNIFRDLSYEGVLRMLSDAGVSPCALTIEITEHDVVRNFPALLDAASKLRMHGIQFALDDFGDGRSSLRLWAELRPEVVKIDKYFVKDVHLNAIKVQTLEGLMRLAETFGTTVVAEGIESAAELQVVRDLGIELGQGYFLGRPAPEPAMQVLVDADAVFASSEVAVLPQPTHAPGGDVTVERLVRFAEPVGPDALVRDVAARFSANESLRGIAVVQDGMPVGLLNRSDVLRHCSTADFFELHGRKSCLLLANTNPVLLDKRAGLEALTAVLTSAGPALPDRRVHRDRRRALCRAGNRRTICARRDRGPR